MNTFSPFKIFGNDNFFKFHQNFWIVSAEIYFDIVHFSMEEGNHWSLFMSIFVNEQSFKVEYNSGDISNISEYSMIYFSKHVIND